MALNQFEGVTVQMDNSDAASMFGTVPFFAALDEKKRKSIAAQGKDLTYKAGDKIVEEGTMGVGFYLILDGQAEVRKGGKALATLSKGQFFGEMSLVDEQPRSADVVALAPTRCWALSSWAFASIAKSSPDIALAMLKEVVKRLRAAQASPTS